MTSVGFILHTSKHWLRRKKRIICLVSLIFLLVYSLDMIESSYWHCFLLIIGSIILRLCPTSIDCKRVDVAQRILSNTSPIDDRPWHLLDTEHVNQRNARRNVDLVRSIRDPFKGHANRHSSFHAMRGKRWESRVRFMSSSRVEHRLILLNKPNTRITTV
jgi:hypothetical protein